MSTVKIKLTKRNVDAQKAMEKTYTAWDTDIAGFGLRVRPSGERSYVLKFRMGREQTWFTIGRHGSPWSPEEARTEAKRLLGEVSRGINPARKRQADRVAMTFAELCDLYIEEGVAHKKPATVKADRGRIEWHLKPKLGRKRVDVVGRADIERLLAEVKTGKVKTSTSGPRGRGSLPVGGAGVAGQCVTLASTILQFAVERGLRADNPARGVKKPPVRKMQRFLSPSELARLADALTRSVEMGGNFYAAAAIRLLALTGARRSEILMLRWRNVDLERGLLLLEDSKTREKAIYLSPPAVEILSTLRRIQSNEFVIVGGRPGAPYVGLSNFWQEIRLKAELPDVRLHDLRHTFASYGAGASLSLPIIGKLLGHTQAQTTARYAHLADDPMRRAADTIGATIEAAMKRSPAENVVDHPTTLRPSRK